MERHSLLKCTGRRGGGDSIFSFVPKSKIGAVNPHHKEKTCFGVDLRDEAGLYGIDWRPLWDAAKRFKLQPESSASNSNSSGFYRNFLHLLAGNNTLGKALDEGWSIQ